MTLREISVLCDESGAEQFGDVMMDEGAMSVTIEDADADSLDEKPLYGEPGMEPERLAWQRSRLRLLVDDDFDAARAIRSAAMTLGIEIPVIESDSAVPDADWVRITQAQFTPTRVSDRLWIVPSWHTPPQPDALNIRLDPGVAFGTGSHPTTLMCLKWLDKNCKGGQSVLDYGCGTGILAIAAAKLGCSPVKGTDIDPQAVEAAQFNANANEVRAEFCLPAALKAERFDIVVANILANPLKMLAPALLSRVAPGGHLVLSGILAFQAEDLIETFAKADPSVRLSVWMQEKDWVCLAGQKH